MKKTWKDYANEDGYFYLDDKTAKKLAKVPDMLRLMRKWGAVDSLLTEGDLTTLVGNIQARIRKYHFPVSAQTSDPFGGALDEPELFVYGYSLNQYKTCVTMCPEVPGFCVGRLFDCQEKCSNFFSIDINNKTVACTADFGAKKEENNVEDCAMNGEANLVDTELDSWTPATKAAQKKVAKVAEEFERFKRKLQNYYVKGDRFFEKTIGSASQMTSREVFFWDQLLRKPLSDQGARIAELEEDNLESQEDQECLSDEVQDWKSKVAELEEGNSNLREALNIQEVKGFKTERELEKENTKCKADVDQMIDELTRLRKENGDLEAKIKALDGVIDVARSSHIKQYKQLQEATMQIMKFEMHKSDVAEQLKAASKIIARHEIQKEMEGN